MVPVLQACVAGQQAAVPFGTAKTAKRMRGGPSLQSLLQVSDGSVRSARGGVAVLNNNIGAPARPPGRK